MPSLNKATLTAFITALSSQFAQGQDAVPQLNTKQSIVDYLKASGMPSDDAAREKLYKDYFSTDPAPYKGTYAQNVRLLEVLHMQNAAATKASNAAREEASRTPSSEATKAERDATVKTAGAKAARAAQEQSAKELKASYCNVDGITVNVRGASNLTNFDALDANALRTAHISRHALSKTDKARYFVIISARETKLPETVGHAWVAFGIQGLQDADAAKPRAAAHCIGSAFGSYPQDNKEAPLSLFTSVPGKIVQGWINNTGSEPTDEKLRLVVEVDETAYAAARNVVATAKNSQTHEYKLLSNDCASLALSVAAAIGLKVPDRKDNMLPTAVVQDLIRKNLP